MNISVEVHVDSGVYISYSAFGRAMAKTIGQQVKKDVIPKFEAVVDDWESAPGFEGRVQRRSGRWELYVYPTGRGAELWSWLTNGVPGRFITPNGPYPLKFRTGYKAKTSPGQPYYRGPGVHTGPTARSMGHWWPGIVPRNFEQGIADDYSPQYFKTLLDGVRRAVRGSQGR